MSSRGTPPPRRSFLLLCQLAFFIVPVPDLKNPLLAGFSTFNDAYTSTYCKDQHDRPFFVECIHCRLFNCVHL